MDISIECRPATAADITALSNLMVELGYPTTTVEMQQRMGAIFTQPDYHTWVAVHNNVVCGMIGFLKIYYWEQNGFYTKIQSLVVKDDYRRHGVGALLIQSCEEWSRQQKAVLMALNCGNKEERAAAHRFYPRMGFEHTSSGYIKMMN